MFLGVETLYNLETYQQLIYVPIGRQHARSTYYLSWAFLPCHDLLHIRITSAPHQFGCGCQSDADVPHVRMRMEYSQHLVESSKPYAKPSSRHFLKMRRWHFTEVILYDLG
ncbi:hypothetical protein EVAR_100177_1 [Eumeta japonica]|uniref:Uncharacterized protein n=1 Tax=Eumeta variegata TaxID=151549 RepID=A0A4C2A2F6_EUMVA|nr:hypothetical protein EVAR_100177_1 [Eumeta japonica]